MTLRDAIDLALADHEVNGRKGARQEARRARHLAALDLSAAVPELPALMRYAKDRRAAGASPASVNRELAILRRGCNLAGIPWPRNWRQLQEAAPRAGFTTRAEVERVCQYLSPGEAALARFLFLTGWRRGEGLALRWSEVDFTAGEVRLLAGTTKNREPRVFPLYPQLRELLQHRLLAGALASDGRVFHDGFGNQLRCFAYHWRRACVKAGLPKLLLHDFRRTAARNLIEAGVDRQVAMKLLGHKTESIFNRYRITTGRELAQAAMKLGALLGGPVS